MSAGSGLSLQGTAARVAALLIAVGCVAFSVLALTRQPPVATPFVAPPGATAVPSPTSPPSVLFIGDSFTEGTGAVSPRQGYPCLTAVAMGWVCNLDAQGGTGFLNNGHLNSARNEPLAARIDDDTQRYVADVVVVDAGRNDGNRPVAQVAAAMRSYLSAVHTAFPRARLVMIVPAYVDSTPANYPFGVQLGQEMRDAVKKYDGVVVDPLSGNWRGDRSMARLTGNDGVHLSPYGQRLWASYLTKALKGAGLSGVRAAPVDSP